MPESSKNHEARSLLLFQSCLASSIFNQLNGQHSLVLYPRIFSLSYLRSVLLFSDQLLVTGFAFHHKHLNMLSVQNINFSISMTLAFALLMGKITEAQSEGPQLTNQATPTPKAIPNSHAASPFISSPLQSVAPSPPSFSISTLNGPVVFTASLTRDVQLEALRANTKYFIVQQYPPHRRMKILLRVDVLVVAGYNPKSRLLHKKSVKDSTLQKHSLRISKYCPQSMCAARLTIMSSKAIRSRIIRMAIKTLSRSRGFGSIFSRDPRRYRIRRNGGRIYIVFVPFRKLYSNII